jgi:hypothetical protein
LGYFSHLNDAPEKIKLHIADVALVKRIPTKRQIEDYERSGAQRRHLKIIRDYMKVQVTGGSLKSKRNMMQPANSR